jgi:anti-sigma factor RsiW
MGKRRVQVRQQRARMRQVKPKLPTAASPQQQRRQQERFLTAGGFLQGYPPDRVVRIGWYCAAGVVVCLLIGVELLLGPVSPHGLPVKIVAAIAWLVPVAVVASFVGPGVRLALQDRKAEPKVVQGQLLGASSVSTSFGLGMVMVQTRGGTEQYLVPAERLNKVPGNQVQVILTVTPKLRYVRGLQVMGQRLVPRSEPPVPDLVKRLRLLPLVTPAALAAAVIVGDDATALSPIAGDALHAGLALVAGLLLGAIVYGAFYLLQRRLTAQAQALVPGA